MKIPQSSIPIYSNLVISAFPESLKDNVIIVLEFIKTKSFSLTENSNINVLINNEHISIPYRFYFPTISENELNHLTDIQQSIFYCLNTRNSNGFIRQKSLEKLLNIDDYYIIPFVFQLSSEYVLEIIQDLDKHIRKDNIPNYLKYFKENHKIREISEARMTSYWNEYYRFGKYKKVNDYPGKKLFKKINILENSIR